MSAEARVYPNTESTKWVHFRRLLYGRGAIMGLALGGAAIVVLGAWKNWIGIMVFGPVALLVVIMVICYGIADKRAEEEFFKAWAAAHGMDWSPNWHVYELTPLLGGGDRRKFLNWMNGGLGGGSAIQCGLGWFTFEVKEENGDKPDTWEPHHFTISVIDLPDGMPRFQGVYLRRKRGIFERMDTDANWLGKHRLEKVELESTAFCEKYELWTDSDQDQIVLRQLFSPKFTLWLAEHPLAPGFEYRAGTLVVFLPDHVGEAGQLDFLLMAVREIANRVQLEIAEARDAGGREPFTAGPGFGAAS